MRCTRRWRCWRNTATRVPKSITDPERRGYLSLLIGLDDAIGRITSYLRKTGTDKDTLIFFFSDNGGSGRKPFLAYNTGVNTPLRGDKGQTLEGGIHVPFFVSWPGKLPAGKTYDQPVITLDILPTACAVAGAKADADFDGVNLLKHLTGEDTTAPHEALYWRFGPQKAIRKGKWKLVDWRDFETKQNSGWQLYDLDQGHRREEQPGGSAAANRRRTQRRVGHVEQAQHCPALARRPH